MTVLDTRRLLDFEQRLQTTTRRRLHSRELWQAFAAAFPGRPQGAEEREWLLQALRSLEERGVVRLPRVSTWERQLGVALPRTVDRVVDRGVDAREWRSFPWHPTLAWVPDLKSLSAVEELFLRRVHDGLVRDLFATSVPLKYRSLQLTGDEKALGALRKGRLFGVGRLDDGLLALIPDVTPLAWAPVGTGPVALTFENAGAFYVARDVLRMASLTAIGSVVFGEGARFISSVRDVEHIEPRPTNIAYVGDIDWNGLAIAREAAFVSSIPIHAAPGFHEAMLRGAAGLGEPDGWPVRTNQLVPAEPSDLLSFVPESSRARVGDVLRQRRRIPEEVLGPSEVLSATIAADRELASQQR